MDKSAKLSQPLSILCCLLRRLEKGKVDFRARENITLVVYYRHCPDMIWCRQEAALRVFPFRKFAEICLNEVVKKYKNNLGKAKGRVRKLLRLQF